MAGEDIGMMYSTCEAVVQVKKQDDRIADATLKQSK